jgi:urease accessory protein
MQRARGCLAVAVKLREGRTVLERFRQEGCLKARLPRAAVGGWTELVTLNSSGGIAQGDVLETAVHAGEGTALTVASQAAERYYRSPGGAAAAVRTGLAVAAGAALEWLPQETILFDGCAVDRRLEVDVAPGGWFVGVETLVFGRAAMGERLQSVQWRDGIAVRRAGRLVWQDVVRLEGVGQALLDRPAVAAGGRAVATLVHVAAGAAAAVDGVRAALAGCDAGVSAFEDLLVARIVAADGACARAAIMAGLAALRAGRPLPRVWSC